MRAFCMYDVIDCDQVKVPRNTVEVVTEHDFPVWHRNSTFGETQVTSNTLELCDRHPEMSITAETLSNTRALGKCVVKFLETWCRLLRTFHVARCSGKVALSCFTCAGADKQA